MKQRILNYRTKIDNLLENEQANIDWASVMQEHLVQISFFQHERLIHLIVTVTFAILTLISIAIVIIGNYFPMMAATFLFIVLLIPYIFHYYLLENEVQKMYEQYDKMRKLGQGSNI